MSRSSQALARLFLRLMAFLSRPRPLTRHEKKEAGLKYCRYAGYGFRWFRGRRVPDEQEQKVIAQIVERRQQGHSWYRIAAHLLRHRIRTAAGQEWSASRVRRAYFAHLRQWVEAAPSQDADRPD